MTPGTRLGRDYFAAVYAAAPDPWSLETRWYEQRKYAVSLAALPSERYADALEVGCSIGVLSRLLSARCDHLRCIDVSAAAVAAAGRRTADTAGVTVEQREVPEQWPPGAYDLIVLSEVGYYFDRSTLASVLALTLDSLRPGGTLLAVHWRHDVADYPLSGDQVHEAIATAAAPGGLARTVRHEEADFVLEVWVRQPPAARSVAESAGLA